MRSLSPQTGHAGAAIKKEEPLISLHLSTEEASAHGKLRRDETPPFSEEEISEKWKALTDDPMDLRATAIAVEERLIKL